ncbi:hypothetical protein Leryth_027492 [Lithospermum erythrorhizon]|uniref:Glycosyltransferase n=1 Tax=Lithospermum erythrorhizon TaxID=34254 RepID=A0AAV3RXY5_LITER|nr:hypothetical protein Leryth_027492 [Lithospermum erythrorhizon]
MASDCNPKKFHIVMFPWFAIGHMTPFLHLSNELAERGHQISLLCPKKAQIQLEHLNMHKDKITFHVLPVPHVEGLPVGTETASEIPMFLTGHLVTAMDLLQDQVKALLQDLNPDFVFFDFSHWIPELAKEFGFKSVCYSVVCAASLAIALVPGLKKAPKTEDSALMEPPEGYPSTKVLLKKHETQKMSFLFMEFGKGITFYERLTTAMRNCDAIGIRSCRELEGEFCDYIGGQYWGKPVILTGPILHEPVEVNLEDRWKNWLDKFDPGTVVYCAFGTQVILEKEQFQELVLGFELTGLPFLVALRTPDGISSIEEALPEGFQERVGERGVIYGGMVDQPAILGHKSVGCFVSHCGFGSMWESLMSSCQIVLIPFLGDQILNTRLLADELEVAVEVERDEIARFSKEGLCNAVLCAMDKDSKVGQTIRKKHQRWMKTILKPDFGSNYMDEFVQQLNRL